MAFDNGLPWQQQYDFNTEQAGDIDDWETLTAANPSSLGATKAIMAMGYVLLFKQSDLSTYYRAPINSSGIIGTWTSGSSGISSSITSAEVLLVGTKVYLLGGWDESSGHPESSTQVKYSTIASDGTLGSWTTTNSLPAGRRFGNAIVVSNRMYYIGGQETRYTTQWTVRVEDSKSTIYYADIDSGGVIGTWSTSTESLPDLRTKAGVALAGDYIYIIGGYKGNNILSTVYVGEVSGSSISNWTTGYSLPEERGDISVVVTEGTIYAIGGHDGGIQDFRVYYSTLTEGLAGNWVQGSSLPFDQDLYTYQRRAASAAVVTSSKVYLLGGFDADPDTNITIYADKMLSASFAGGENNYSEIPPSGEGVVDQEAPSFSGDVANPIQCAGNAFQEEPAFSGVGVTPIVCYGEGDQGVVISFGVSYSPYSGVECATTVEQLCPELESLGDNPAITGNMLQSEPAVDGVARTPIACFGDAVKYLNRSSGLAYLSDFGNLSDVQQSAPLPSGVATTWNIGISNVVQSLSESEGEATSPFYLAAVGSAVQNFPTVQGTALGVLGSLGRSIQPHKQVSGRAASISVCSGNVFQPIHVCKGRSVASIPSESLAFFRCTDGDIPTIVGTDQDPLAFSRPSCGDAPTMDAQVPTPLSFSR